MMPYFFESVLKAALFLRILRIFRIARSVKTVLSKEANKLISTTMSKSIGALSLMFVILMLGVTTLGFTMYVFEQGEFIVNKEFPEGKYLRFSIDKDRREPSPFGSCFAGFYWAIVTATTVGYGDLVPTSDEGRILAAITVIFGVIMIALPISVICENFSDEYTIYLERRKLRELDDESIEASNQKSHPKIESDSESLGESEIITYSLDENDDHKPLKNLISELRLSVSEYLKQHNSAGELVRQLNERQSSASLIIKEIEAKLEIIDSYHEQVHDQKITYSDQWM
jgi:hypothetical protein